MIDRRHVLHICRKELLDFVRDRRTLFVMIVLPVLLYPMLVIGLSWISRLQLQQLRERQLTIVVVGREHADRLVERLLEPERNLKLVGVADLPEHVRAAMNPGAPPAPAGSGDEDAPSELETLRDRYGAAISEDAAAAILLVPDRFEARVEEGENLEVEILFNEGVDASVEAKDRIDEAMVGFRDALVVERLARHDIEPSVLRPVALREVDLGGGLIVKIGRALSMLLVILSITGAFYPAVDTGAGEKERGTLETLLVSPAKRWEVALAKYLAVCVVALFTVVLNLASMGLTVAHLASMLPGEGEVRVDATVVFTMAIAMIPLVLLFVALALALSTQARSTKEANNYLTPLLLAASLPAMAPAIPGLELNEAICLVPVAGTALLIKELLAGTAHLSHVILIFAANTIYAAAALKWVASLYGREEVLLRLPSGGEPPPRTKRKKGGEAPVAGGGGGGWEMLDPEALATEPDAFARARANPAEIRKFLETALDRPGSTAPDLTHGLLLAAVVLVVTFYAGPALAGRLPASLGLLPIAAILTLVVVLGPVLVAMRVGRYKRPLEVLGLRRSPALSYLGAVLVAPGAIVTSLFLQQSTAGLFGAPAEADPGMNALVEQIGSALPLAWLCLALVPAVCEELLYRGFVQGAARRSVGPAAAILLSSVLFALNHGDVSKLPAYTFVGLVLGVIAFRAGGIGPTIVLHMLFNGLAVTLETYPDLIGKVGLPTAPGESISLLTIVVAEVLVVLGLGVALAAAGPAEEGPGPDGTPPAVPAEAG